MLLIRKFNDVHEETTYICNHDPSKRSQEDRVAVHERKEALGTESDIVQRGKARSMKDTARTSQESPMGTAPNHQGSHR